MIKVSPLNANPKIIKRPICFSCNFHQLVAPTYLFRLKKTDKKERKRERQKENERSLAPSASILLCPHGGGGVRGGKCIPRRSLGDKGAIGGKSTLQSLCVEDDASLTGIDSVAPVHVALKEKKTRKKNVTLCFSQHQDGLNNAS